MIHTLTGRVRDLAGNAASRDVTVDVDASVPGSWGSAILAWIQPMALSLGQAFYAAPDGSDSNPGTITSPWRSLSKANTLQPGQKLVLRAGLYGGKGTSFSWTAQGTQSAPVTIEAFPGERPIVEGHTTLNGGWQRWAGTYFRGPTGPTGGPGPNGESILVSIRGAHLELLSCEMAYDQWHAGIGANAATTDYRILGCYVHDNGGLNGDYTDSQNNTSHGLYLSPSSFGLVANCLIQHNDAKGQMGRHDSHHLLIVHNTIVANGRHGTESYEQSNTWTWANNIVINNGNVKGGSGISMGGAGPGFLQRRNVYWHNGAGAGTANWGGTGTVIEPKVADPKLVRPAVYTPQQDLDPNWDHHLLPDSPAIGYGEIGRAHV